MAFWKFGFAPVASGIDLVLNQLPSSSPSSSSSPISSSFQTTAAAGDTAEQGIYESTLDALLANPDLLSEIKAGSNDRLSDFLARAESIQRLGGWVLWGLGGDQEEVPPSANGGIIADDVEDGKVPDVVVAPGEKKLRGMGGVPRRRDMDEWGVLEGESKDETEMERQWAGYPRLAMEVLAGENPSLATVLFDHEAASSFPSTCPHPRAFLVPFWETLLRSTELQLETRAVLVGYWARVNIVLLNGPRGLEALQHIQTIPNLLPRLLTLLPSCSPINDIVLLILRISHPPSPILTSIVPSTLRMLDPVNTLGKMGHLAAEELLKGIIELCSAAPTNSQPPLPPNGGGQGGQDQEAWRDNALARQLAEGRTVRTMVEWMLDGLSISSGTSSSNEGEVEGVERVSHTPSAEALSELRTSSLIQSISVLVDLIRKNNSDFVEQQMLIWARKRETEEMEREMLEADGKELVGAMRGDERGGEGEDKGPSLVDLGALLEAVASRLEGFQHLIKKPRSLHGPSLTTSGTSIIPLTLERFRICEMYAELLHCSNMSLLNRSPSFSTLYNKDGYLAKGWRGADELAEAMQPTSEARQEEDEEEEKAGVLHPEGLSTPSSPRASLYSEPDEVESQVQEKEPPGTAMDDEDEEDPFGDPVEPSSSSPAEGSVASARSVEDLAKDAEAMQLDDTPVPPSTARFSAGTARTLATPLTPGQLLKSQFIEHRVLNTMLDLFFEFPWNNFLHNVVYDLVQQIFHGRIDRALDRQLALSVFLDAKLIDRILKGQEANEAAQRERPSTRLGYMGHMTLIAEEVVKLFSHYPSEIYAHISSSIPQPAWDLFVSTTLRETRERDLNPLGGGVAGAKEGTPSVRSGISDEDDEFPMHSARIIRAMEAANNGMGAAGKKEERRDLTEDQDDGAGATDQFSRYLRTAISSSTEDKFNSSDEDDDEVDDGGWLRSGSSSANRFESGDVDFSLPASFSPSSKAPATTKVGLDEAFALPSGSASGAASNRAFQRAPDLQAKSSFDEEDADWGDFPAVDPTTAFGDDDFAPHPSTSQSPAALGFETSFSTAPFDAFTPTTSRHHDEAEDDDGFGDFESASPSIQLPSMDDALDDFDLHEEGRSPAPLAQSSFATPAVPSLAPPSKPVFARTITADDGSDLFGGLSSPTGETFPTPPSRPPATLPATGPPAPLSIVPPSTPPPPQRRRRASSSASSRSCASPGSPSMQADLATSPDEPLGPSMHVGSALTEDGFVEATVEGKKVRVPADEIALAHRRSSLEGQERPAFD